MLKTIEKCDTVTSFVSSDQQSNILKTYIYRDLTWVLSVYLNQFVQKGSKQYFDRLSKPCQFMFYQLLTEWLSNLALQILQTMFFVALNKITY